ncbi:MAG: hypothetical protein ACRDPO_33665 [Streptosporangiaceae bacterium]
MTAGTHVGYESWLERDHMMLLDFDPAVTAIAAQPFWLRWRAEDGRMPWADDAAERLAVISGSATAAIRAALPAFATESSRPVRAATACRLCTTARRISQPVPVHLPAHHQVCLKHGIWLSGPGTPQISVSGCPDILAAERQARRLRRRCTTEHLIYARLQATPGNADHEWKRRMAALIESNPGRQPNPGRRHCSKPPPTRKPSRQPQRPARAEQDPPRAIFTDKSSPGRSPESGKADTSIAIG